MKMMTKEEGVEAEGERVRSDTIYMQKEVRNAEAKDDFKENIIKAIAKLEGWSATNLSFQPVTVINMTYKNEEDKEDDENDETDTKEEGVEAEGEGVRSDTIYMQKDVRNAEAKDDFKKTLLKQ